MSWLLVGSGTLFIEMRLKESTPMALESLKNPAIRAAALATTPLKKIAKPEDITGTIAFLASWKLSGHISGEIITMYDIVFSVLISSAGGMEGRQLNTSAELA